MSKFAQLDTSESSSPLAPQLGAPRPARADAPVGRREKRKLEIRGRIEDAAYRLFRRHGLDKTSIEQICAEADVARRTFYGHFANKQALLAGLGMSRLYSQSEPMLHQLLAAHETTRARLAGMIEYIEDTFAGYDDLDRELILAAPTSSAEAREQRRAVDDSAIAAFIGLIEAGRELGDVTNRFSSEILASMIVGTLASITVSWAGHPDFPIAERLGEARELFEFVICGAGD